MLRKSAQDDRNPAQFIVTTFHPQILQASSSSSLSCWACRSWRTHGARNALHTPTPPRRPQVSDQVYGVTHKSRVSQIRVVTREQGLKFVEADGKKADGGATHPTRSGGNKRRRAEEEEEA